MGTAAAPYGTVTPVPTNFVFQTLPTVASTNIATVSAVNSLQTSAIQVLQLDACIRTVHTSHSEVTRHPVEYGSDLTDNARPTPQELLVEGFVSGTPTNQPGVSFPVNGNPAVQFAFYTLRNLQETATVIDVVTRLNDYPNMMIENLEFPEDAELGDSLRFTCKLVAVRIISSQTVTPPAAVKHAQGKASQGPTTTTPATPQVQTSAAFDMVQAYQSGGAQSAPLNTSGS